MDLREKKTKRSITNAFLQLRSHKPLERITVKELSEAAEISKATFYLHYKDIYDLSEQLEKEIIQTTIQDLAHPDDVLTNPVQFLNDLLTSFYAKQNIIAILFSGSRANILPHNLEAGIKEHLFSQHPELQEDAAFNIQLTYQIKGCYYAYMDNKEVFGDTLVVETLNRIIRIPGSTEFP